MSTVTLERSAADQIRASTESWMEAVRAGDIDDIMAHYASDVVAFDAVAALRFVGAETYRAHFAECLEMCPGEVRMSHRDLDVLTDGDLAVARFLLHCAGTDEEGQEQGGWMRATVCWRRAGGQWVIAHEHYSAPFDPESGQALMALEP